MAITEVLQGCGAWDLKWASRPPAEVLHGIGDVATLLVFPGQVVTSALTDADRVSALFEGPITTRSTGGLSGWEASWLMQRPNGDGYRFRESNGNTVSNVSDYLGDAGTIDFCSDTATWPSNGLTEGDMIGAVTSFTDNTPNTTGGSYFAQWGPRTYLDFFIEQLDAATGFDHAWRIRPGLLIDVHLRSTLFRDREIILSDSQTSSNSGEAFNIPSTVDSVRTVDDYVARAWGISSDGSSVGYFSEVTNATSVASPGAENLRMEALVRPPNKDGTASGYLQRYADAHGPRVAVQATPLSTGTRSRVSPGDLLWVYSDYGFAEDSTIDVLHYGQEIHPLEMWALSMTWEPTRANGVVARTTSGEYIDVAPYLALGDHDQMRLTLSDSWMPPHTANGLVDTDRLSAVSGRWRYQTPLLPGYTGSINIHGGPYTHQQAGGYSINQHGGGYTRA